MPCGCDSGNASALGTLIRNGYLVAVIISSCTKNTVVEYLKCYIDSDIAGNSPCIRETCVFILPQNNVYDTTVVVPLQGQWSRAGFTRYIKDVGRHAVPQGCRAQGSTPKHIGLVPVNSCTGKAVKGLKCCLLTQSSFLVPCSVCEIA